MRMTNEQVAIAFANGATEGESSRMSIRGDKLYSYAMPVAKRLDDGFEVSNNTAALGGGCVSQTTSCHIGLAHYHCKPCELVDKIT